MPSSHARRSLAAIALASLVAGCGARPAQSLGRTMPSPDGCFVQVWNGAGFAGTSDFINGPVEYRHLRDLPSRRSWKDRIGSLRLGPKASAVAWSAEQFSGRSVMLAADSREQGAFAALPLKIQSLDIRCGTRPQTESR
jgi:hypothetical protein